MITPGYSLQELSDLQSDAPYYQRHPNFMNIRLKAIKEAAESLGMKSGLAYESRVIDHILSMRAEKLDQVFDFRMVLYKNNVLPPVIVQARDLVQIGNKGDTIRVGGHIYRIVSQVRFVTAPPSWRDYLWMNYPEPEYPNQVLLPKNEKERAIWQASIAKGWKEGIQQAIGIYDINLHRLSRDFNGMVLYKSLLAQNMISPYALTKVSKGITGNANHMVIDDQTWNIVSKPQLQVSGHLWQPVLTGVKRQWNVNKPE